VANGWGGRRRGAGREKGGHNRIPQNKKDIDRLKEIVTAVETSGYLLTDDGKPYTGTALELAQLMYRAIQLPVQYRLMAMKIAIEYEPKPLQDTSEFGIVDRTIDAVTTALVPYPEARQAVLEVLIRLENERRSPVVIEARPVAA
jgi:hypothetical protein